MSSTPLPKRRRLGTSSSNALSKPFKSPFKTPLKQIPVSISTSITPTPANTPITNSSSPSFDDPAATLASLQKRHTALLAKLSASRASLETCTQALKLESSSSDRELESLVMAWKRASWVAAEEVFDGVKSRVERMGGVRGWKEMEGGKRKNSGWGWEGEKGGRAGERVEGDADEREEEGEADIERNEEEDERPSQGCDDEEEFTMAMMLQSLSIELDVIGYDKEGQRWID